MYTYSNNHSYLAHHGVLGQRWGFRRYRNADGSLTPAGKRKAASYAKKYSKLTGRDVEGRESKSSNHSDAMSMISPKPVNEMSNKELQSAKNRYDAVYNYNESRKRYEKQVGSGNNHSKPVKVAMAIAKVSEKPVTEAYQDILESALKNYGKHVLKEMGQKQKGK